MGAGLFKLGVRVFPFVFRCGILWVDIESWGSCSAIGAGGALSGRARGVKGDRICDCRSGFRRTTVIDADSS